MARYPTAARRMALLCTPIDFHTSGRLSCWATPKNFPLQEIVDGYGGDAAALWTRGEPDGAEVLRRLKALPGFGEQKARIFLALLGKQYGVSPKGWRAAAGDYGKPGTHMSIADVVDKGSLDRVRSYKKAMKAAAKEKKA